MLHMGQGRLDEAVADLQTALEIALDAGNLRFETNVHRYMGDLAQLQGCLDEALQQFERALVLAREASYRSGEGQVLACLWRLHNVLGRMAEAHREPSGSEFILREVQDPLNPCAAALPFRRVRTRGRRPERRGPASVEAISLAQGLAARADSERGREIVKLRAALQAGASGTALA